MAQLASRLYLTPHCNDRSEAGHKVYIFTAPVRRGGGNVFWDFRRIHVLLGIGEPLSRWWTRVQRRRIPDSLAQRFNIDLDVDVMPSKKAYAARTEQGNHHIFDEAHLQGEYTLSTLVALFLLLEWSLSLVTKKARSRAIVIMQDLCTLIVGPSPPPILWSALARAMPPRDSKPCDSPALGPRSKHMCFVFDTVALFDVGSWGAIVDVLQQCMKSAKVCDFVCGFLQTILTGNSGLIDEAIQEGEASCMSTDPCVVAHPKGQVRSRRLDKHLVEHFVAAAVQNKQFPSAGRAARAFKTLDERTARTQEEGYMARYLASTIRSVYHACQAFVVCDDVRVSSEKNQCGATWVRQRRLAACLVPQAPCVPSSPDPTYPPT